MQAAKSVKMSKVAYHPTSGKRIRGVIFDMDGSICHILLNVDRERLGIQEGDVLTKIYQYQGAQKQEALRIIDEIEEEGRQKLELQPGLKELLHYLHSRGIHRSIVTRNTHKSIEHFQQKLREAYLSNSHHPSENTISHIIYDFSHTISRESPLPFKPDPAGPLWICEKWNINPEEAIFVGDFRDDLVCGGQAGNVTCLLNNPTNEQFRNMADINIDSLDHLIHHLENGFEVEREDKTSS